MDKDEYSNESIFAQILVAVTDFDVFMTMMREVSFELLFQFIVIVASFIGCEREIFRVWSQITKMLYKNSELKSHKTIRLI